MKRLTTFLQEMKLHRGEHGNYYQVRSWAEVRAVFDKITAPDFSRVHDRDFVDLLGIDRSFKSLRLLIYNGKAYVWDGFHGVLHSDAYDDLGLDVDVGFGGAVFDHDGKELGITEMYISTNGKATVVERNGQPVTPAVTKLVQGAPGLTYRSHTEHEDLR